MRNTSYVDSFDLGQAFKDWIRIITQPAAFFQEMTGTTGFSAPLAISLLYLGPVMVAAIINTMKLQLTAGTLNPAFAIGAVFGMIIGLAIVVPLILLGMFFFAWIMHMVGLLFGNKSPFSASFRALAFSYAPAPLLQIPIALFGNGLQGLNPITGLIGFVGFVWFSVLLVMAVSSEQEISTGPAVGVVVITYIVLGVIAVVIGFIFAAVFASLFSGMFHSMH